MAVLLLALRMRMRRIAKARKRRCRASEEEEQGACSGEAGVEYKCQDYARQASCAAADAYEEMVRFHQALSADGQGYWL